MSYKKKAIPGTVQFNKLISELAEKTREFYKWYLRIAEMG